MKKYNKEKGSFILELMIGLFLSSVTILGVVYVYINFELSKKSTIQLGKTISTAAISLYPIQENIKMAGYGFNLSSNNNGCTTIKAYNSTLSPSSYDIVVSQKPLDIVSSGNNTSSDQILVSYATSTSNTFSPSPVTLTTANNGSNQNWVVSDVSKFSIGDMTLIYNTAAPGTCIIQQVTGITTSTKTLTYNAIQSENNSGIGLGVSFPAGTTQIVKVNTNSIPKTISFQINGVQLTQTDNIYSLGNNSVIGDNIVMLKAIIGLDKNSDGIVDEWKTNLVTTDYQYISGIKVAILSRSTIRENKGLTGNSCVITTNKDFTWDNGLGTGVIDVSDFPDWKCYRYRLLQTTIPLKNIMWAK